MDIILNGANGRMGRMVTEMLAAGPDGLAEHQRIMPVPHRGVDHRVSRLHRPFQHLLRQIPGRLQFISHFSLSLFLYTGIFRDFT